MSDEVRKYFEIEVEVHHSGISALKPGVRLGDIDDQFINPIYRKHGLLDARTFGTGHSFGIMHYWYGRDEIGEIRPYNDTILEPGMVMSIEPMIAIDGVGGFKHADMFVVQEDGVEQLTNFNNGVIVID
jgi:creatinase